MELIIQIAIFVVALIVLLKSSDWFIDSAESIGLSLGISPFIIGVTIIAFGTSLPELATSIAAIMNGENEVVIGNVVGSNITNIALVLGIVAIVVKEIKLDYNIWHIDMPFLWASAFLLYFMVLDQHLSVFEAILMLVGLGLFLAYSFSSNEKSEEECVPASKKDYVFVVLGAIGVALGAQFTISAISKLSVMAGIPSDIIAVTVVALGTSLPEVIVSVNAAKKGKTSIAVGNVMGSNIFNTFVVMSIPSFFGEIIIPDNFITFTIPFMLFMTLMFGLISNNKKINRWEGAILLLCYFFFVVETLN